MDRNLVAMTALLALAVFASGCTRVRTYVVEKERVDQNLTSGNAGYLAGTPRASDVPVHRKLTRQTYVTEIEVGSAPKRIQSGGRPVMVQTAQEPEQETAIEKPMEATEAGLGRGAVSASTYTVENNDTLEQISRKVYGTPLKWKLIFEANKEKLKNNPNRIYAGQVLDIPRE